MVGDGDEHLTKAARAASLSIQARTRRFTHSCLKRHLMARRAHISTWQFIWSRSWDRLATNSFGTSRPQQMDVPVAQSKTTAPADATPSSQAPSVNTSTGGIGSVSMCLRGLRWVKRFIAYLQTSLRRLALAFELKSASGAKHETNCLHAFVE